MPVGFRERDTGTDHEPVLVGRVVDQLGEHLTPLRRERVVDAQQPGGLQQRLAAPPDQRDVVVAVRRGAVLRGERRREVQLAVGAGGQEVQVVVHRLAQHREQHVPQHTLVHAVPVVQPHVVQQPRQVADLRIRRRKPWRANESGVVELGVGTAPDAHRVGTELRP
jgi:hypothetical protein